MQIHVVFFHVVINTLFFFLFQSTSAEMPILTEKEQHNQLWKRYQTRVKNDIMIPYGLDFHNEVKYFVDWEKKYSLDQILGPNPVGDPDQDAKTLLLSNMNCKELFGNGQIFYRAYGTKGQWEWEIELDPSEYYYLNMKPFDAPSQAVISRIRTCCDPSKCREKCFQVPEVNAAPFIITTPDSVSVIAGGYCTYCAIKPCVSQCSEGEFATNGAVLDAVIS